MPDYPSLAKKGIKGLRVGLLTEGFAAAIHDPKISELVRRAAARLQDLGAVVSTVSVPMHRTGPDLWAIIGRLGASQVALGRSSGRRNLALNDFSKKTVPVSQEAFNEMFVSSKNTIINGEYAWKHMDPTLHGKATNLVRKLRDAYDGAMEEVDVLLMPTLPVLPPKHVDEGTELDGVMKNCFGVTLNTAPFNLVSPQDLDESLPSHHFFERMLDHALTSRLDTRRSQFRSALSPTTQACGYPSGCSWSGAGGTKARCTLQAMRGSRLMTGRILPNPWDEMHLG